MALAGLNRSSAIANPMMRNAGEGRRSIFNMTQRSKMKHLKSLEHDANLQPEDAFRQLRFLQELNKNYPALVIRRIEENRFAVDEAVQKEYIKALVKCVTRMLSIAIGLYLPCAHLFYVYTSPVEPVALTLWTCQSCSPARSASALATTTAAVCPSTAAVVSHQRWRPAPRG